MWTILPSSLLLLLPALQALPQYYPFAPHYPNLYPVPVLQWTVFPFPVVKTISEEERAKSFLDRAELELEAHTMAGYFAAWNYQTNLTEANKEVSLVAEEATFSFANFY